MGEHKTGGGGENRRRGLLPANNEAIEFPYRDSALLLAAMRDQFKRSQFFSVDDQDRETAVEHVWRMLATRRFL